ncbi:HD domain-containing protein [Nocardia otitidiscaviarum]|uniref:HD domain-containing protein n=1 Tax=Nocardia otitidiscaviarum TaxID=1823 RepID=UPI001895DE1A|nr:HD domain-containing protein [Nocardia otitidiscaviarum]MBF6236649.1 HD domain-containing protein [Nocardia otitidiscaviarum]
MSGDRAAWAEGLASAHLKVALPRRWSHVQGVVHRAASAGPVVDDPDVLMAAAWLHDIGYAPKVRRTGLHAVDGAEYLRQLGADDRLCGLVAHHSCAHIEAANRGIPINWSDERTPLRDALWWADMTTTPLGQPIDIKSRIAEVRKRYGSDHVVAVSVTEAEPELLAAAERTELLLSKVPR